MRCHPSDNVCINLPRKVDIFELLLSRERYLVQPFKEFILLASGERNVSVVRVGIFDKWGLPSEVGILRSCTWHTKNDHYLIMKRDSRSYHAYVYQ